MAKGTVDKFFLRITFKLAKIFNLLLQKGISEATNSEVNTVANVKASTTSKNISNSIINDHTRNSKNVSRVGSNVNIEYLYCSFVTF